MSSPRNWLALSVSQALRANQFGWRRLKWAGLVMVALTVGAAACSSDGPAEAPRLEGIETNGVSVSVVAEDLVGPTQIAFAPDGSLLVAELNGAENAGTGRVLRLDLAGEFEPEVLQTGLDKPTGIATVGAELWIMERQQLSRVGLMAGDRRSVVVEDMPFNGRSQGTLTASPAGDLMYNTSGRRDGNRALAGSATLFALNPATDGSTVVATGLKHAYAHTFDADGTLWVTEVSDGTYDGRPPADELVAVVLRDDFAWPACIDDRVPVAEFGGTADGCEATPPSHALFDPQATPTSVVVAPWDDDMLLVALWVPGEVVAVPREPGVEPHRGEVLVSGLSGPQHLLVDGDRVLLSEHQTGRILAIEAP